MKQDINLIFEEMVDDLNYLKIAVCFKRRKKIRSPRKQLEKIL